jgi:hypothetical protein
MVELCWWKGAPGDIGQLFVVCVGQVKSVRQRSGLQPWHAAAVLAYMGRA